MKTEKCYYCERPFGVAVYGTEIVLLKTKDHVIPKSKGGNNTQTNLVPACGKCNYLKDSYLPNEFANYINNFIDCYLLFSDEFVNLYPTHILERIVCNSEQLHIKIESIKSYCLKQIKAPIGFDVRPKRKLIKKPKIFIDTELSKKIIKSVVPKKKKSTIDNDEFFNRIIQKKESRQKKVLDLKIGKDKNKEHTIICEYTWGGVPTDTVWAKNSPLYEETKNKLIERGIIHNLKSIQKDNSVPTFKTNELTHHEWAHRYNLEPESNFHYE